MIILIIAFALLFACAEIAYHAFSTQAEYTRKFVHVGTGLITLAFPFVLSNHWEVMFLCGSFLLILWISQQVNLLPSINAINRKSFGSLAYPIIVYLVFFAFDQYSNRCCEGPQYALFFIPILIMAICDPVAAFVGKVKPILKLNGLNKYKSLGGFLGFSVVAFLLSFLLLAVFHAELSWLQVVIASAVLAVVSGLTEVLSRNGWDNFSIPAVCVFVLFVMIYA